MVEAGHEKRWPDDVGATRKHTCDNAVSHRKNLSNCDKICEAIKEWSELILFVRSRWKMTTCNKSWELFGWKVNFDIDVTLNQNLLIFILFKKLNKNLSGKVVLKWKLLNILINWCVLSTKLPFTNFLYWKTDKNSWEFPGDHEKDWKDYQELQEDAAGLKDDEVVVRFMFELCKRETKYEVKFLE